MSILGNMKDMMNMAAKAKEIQANMKAAQAEIADYSVTVTDPTKCVEIQVGGDLSIHRVKISYAADNATIEQATFFAVNQALNEMKLKIQARMKEATGGIDIPGL